MSRNRTAAAFAVALVALLLIAACVAELGAAFATV